MSTFNDENLGYNEVRAHHEAEERWNKNQRGHRWIGVSILLLALGCGAGAWFAYPMLQDHEAAAGQLPEIQRSVGELGDRMATQITATAANESESVRRNEELRKQFNGALDAVRTRIATTGKQAQEAATAVFTKAQAEFTNQVGRLSSRIAGVESSRETDRASLNALEQELSQTRNQLAAQSQQVAALRGDLERQVKQNSDEIAGTQSQLTSLGQRQVRDRTDFDALATNVARKRIDFEVRKNQSLDVAPGIAIAIHKTNVSYQRASGWVSAPDRRTIWLRDVRTQEPVVLIHSSDGRQQELVITRVSENAVAGYVVLPADALRGEPLARSGVASAGQ